MLSFRNRKKKKLQQEQMKGAPLITYFKPQSILAEQFRTIRTNIQFANMDNRIKSLVVTSSIPAEGKSFVAANLAYSLATTDNKVLIVDTDLRKPTLHRTFALDNSQGLTTLLTNPEIELNDIILRSPELNLSLLPSGPVPPNPAEILGSRRMTAVMRALSNYFDLIIYDTPPLTSVTDAQIMSTKVDGTILVVREGYVRRGEIRKALDALNSVESNVLGFIMNDVNANEDSSYYSYYGYDSDSK